MHKSKKIALNMKKVAQEDDDYGFGYGYRPEDYVNFAKALPEDMTGYDFGGAEQPYYPGLVIVDVISPLDPTVFGSNYPDIQSNEYIEGDLTIPLDLEPKPFVNLSNTLSPLSFADDLDAMFLQVVDNIDRALLPGGRVRLLDDAYLVLPVFNLLKNLGYIKVWDHNEEPPIITYKGEVIKGDDEGDEGDRGTYEVILQKPE